MSNLIQADSLKRFFIKEAPTGAVNGTNTAFTLSQEPLENDAVNLFLDGLALTPTTHYSLSGTSITMASAPVLGQSLRAEYVQKTGGV